MNNDVEKIIRSIVIDPDVESEYCIILAEHILLIFYMNRYSELGIITPGAYQVTTEGFDVAMSLLEIGFKASPVGIWRFIYKLIEEEKLLYEDKDDIYLLLENMQEKGYDNVKEEIEMLKDES